MKEYYTYIVKSLKDGKRYTGITSNIERRVVEHNRGSSSTPSTKHSGPFVLVYKETHPDMISARKREKFFKSGAGREWIKNNIALPPPKIGKDQQ